LDKETKEKLAGSLTAETTDLIPYLPYLLQDFWELGSDPNTMANLLKEVMPKDAKILDLACGKGAVSVTVTKKLGVQVKGFDIIPEFIDTAVEKAKEHEVAGLCDFEIGDINEVVETSKGYDAVVLGGVGDVLGRPIETLRKLKQTINPVGYILIDECYLKDDSTQEDIGYDNYEYLTKEQWDKVFADSGLEIVKAVVVTDVEDSAEGMAAIRQRADELIEKYPSKKDMFEGYVQSQQSEYDDIDNSLVGVIWLLKFV